MTLVKFYAAILRILSKKKVHVVYTYMSNFHPILLWPLKPLFGFKTVMWYGHTVAGLLARISIRFCADLWLTANQSVAPFRSRNLRFVGHGIDTGRFHPMETPKKYDLVTVGRITPIKGLDQMLDVLERCRQRYDRQYRLLVCGDAYLDSDIAYRESLQERVAEMGLQDRVVFAGMVPHHELPKTLNSARIFLFLTPGGVGKASLEAMACGIPPVMSSPDASDALAGELPAWLLSEPDTDSVAASVFQLLEASADDFERVRKSMLDLVERRYRIEDFVDRVVALFEQECARGGEWQRNEG